jgi:hypothetical protein
MLAAIRRVQSGIQAQSLIVMMWFFCVGVAPSFGADTSSHDTLGSATVTIIDTAPFVPLQVISVNVSVVSEATVIGTPELSLPAIQNAVWLQPSQHSYTGYAIHEGKRRPVFNVSVGLLLRQSGRVTIDPIHLSLPMMSKQGRVMADFETMPLSFAVDPLVATEEGAFIVPATQLSLDSQLGPQAQWRVGDIVEQIVTIKLSGATVLALGSVALARESDADSGGLEASGSAPLISIQPERLPLESETRYVRGEVQVEQKQVLRYVIKTPGAQLVPPVELRWWDTTRHELITLTTEPHLILAGVTPGTVVLQVRDWILLGYLPVALAFGWLVMSQRERLHRFGMRYRKLRAPVLPDRLNP